MAPSELARVRRARRARDRADEELRQAVVAAAAAGHSFAAIGDELGVSRQAVRVMVKRASS